MNILFITQNSSYFVHKNFLNTFEKNKGELIFVSEKKRGIHKKYIEIIKYFGLFNLGKIIFLEIFYKFLLYERINSQKITNVDDENLNTLIENKLNNKKFDSVISIGCPCSINIDIAQKYNLKILNLHGGIIPFQKGRYSPLKSIKKGHKYLGCTLHIINQEFDSGEILSQDFLILESNNILFNYNAVLNLSAHLLNSFLIGEYKKLPTEVLKSFENFT